MSDDLEMRAWRLLNGSAGSLPARVNASSGPQIIRIAFNCSVRPRAFVVVTERHGDTLHMLRNEVAQGGSYSGPVTAPAILGSFRFDRTIWPGCPHCGTRENIRYNVCGFWTCNDCGGFNCPGHGRWGGFHCSCGRVATSFVRHEFFTVRGTAQAAAEAPRVSSGAWGYGYAPAPPPSIPAAILRAETVALPQSTRATGNKVSLPGLPGKR
jgi:hypothetical protein